MLSVVDTLFSAPYYAQQARCSEHDALEHFLAGGWRSHDPHVLFDTSYVLSRWGRGAVYRDPFDLYEQLARVDPIFPAPFVEAGWMLAHEPDLRRVGIDPVDSGSLRVAA